MRDPVPAVLAWLRHDVPDHPPLCLVCALGPAGPTVTLCTARSGLVSVIDTATVRAEADERWARPEARRPSVLRRAAADPRYRDAVVFDDAGGPVPAGELIDSFASYGAALTAAVRRVLARAPDSHADLGFLALGAAAGFPPVSDVLAAAVPAGARALGDVAAEVDVVRRGAELLTSGAIRFPDAYPHAVTLRTREVRHGRIANGRTVVATAHTLTANGPAVSSAAVVTVGTGAVALDVEIGADRFRPVVAPAVAAPAPGRYAVDLRLVHGVAELAFRPHGGGAAAVRTVGPLPDEGPLR